MRMDPQHAAIRSQGACLATVEIIYRMPDHPALLQTFVWQHWDTAPHFPALKRFLDYWEANLDGPIHSVHVARLAPGGHRALRHARHLKRLH
ncbi:MAG: usg protein [Rhodospirillales bacterium]|nr:usg protein [Rhodospirillales bacterium]